MFKEINTLVPFFEEPSKEFNVRETARLLKITPATASKRLKELFKKEILKHRKERILDLYRANQESDSYKDLKTYYNIRKIRDSGLMESLNKFYLKPTIVLFGSFSNGMDTETSDIDLIVISENNREFPDLGAFKKKLKREIQIFYVKHLKELRNRHIINNVLNGIVLQGELIWI